MLRIDRQASHRTTGTSFRTTGTANSFRTTGTGTSFRTNGTGSFRTTSTYRSGGTNKTTKTARTLLTAGSEGSLMMHAYKAPKMLNAVKGTSVDTPSKASKGERTAGLPLDDEFNRVMASMDETMTTPSSVMSSSNTKSKKKKERVKQRNAPQRILQRIFRRRDLMAPSNKNSKKETTKHKASVLPITSHQGREFTIAEKSGERGKGMLVSASNGLQKRQYHPASKTQKLSKDAAQVLSGRPSKRQVEEEKESCEQQNDWVGSILMVPNTTRGKEKADAADGTAKIITKTNTQTTTTSEPKKKSLYKQASCRSLFESFKWSRRNLTNKDSNLDYDDLESDICSTDGAASCSKPPALQEATSTSSSIQFMLDQIKQNDAPDDTESSSMKPFVPPPPCLQVTTSMSSVSSSHLFEWTVSTTTSGGNIVDGHKQLPRLEVKTSSHSIQFRSPIKDKAHARANKKVVVDIDKLPSPPLLVDTTSAASIEMLMRNIQEQRNVSEGEPQLQRATSSTSSQLYEWESNADARQDDPTLPPCLRLTISSSSTEWNHEVEEDSADGDSFKYKSPVRSSTMTTKTSSANHTLEWKSFNQYFDKPIPLSQRPYSYVPPPRFQAESSASTFFQSKREAAASNARSNEFVVGLGDPKNVNSDPKCSIEIAPGHTVAMRGAEETMLYVAADTTCDKSEKSLIATFSCWTCCTTMHCMVDAAYVLCPKCRTVQPTSLQPSWGAGLGFLSSDWDKWKRELMHE